MTQIIIIFVCLFLLLWLFQVPHVKSIKIESPTRYHTSHSYGPIGLKVWTVGLSIISALIPIWNIISVIILVIILIIRAAKYDLDWIEIFPNKPNRKKSKIMQFLNKTLYD